MAQSNSFVKKAKEDERSGARKRWWLSTPESVGSDLTTYCASLESAQQRDRYLGMVFEQLATGRAPQSYGIAMHGRVVGDMATALFSPPSENYVAIAKDVFANKIGKNRPFLEWVPLAKSDTDIRASCVQATDYVEQLFNDLNTWPMVAQMFDDGFTQGTGLIMVDGVPGRVQLTRIHRDECLLDPTAGDAPRNFQFRFFVARDAAISKYVEIAVGKERKKLVQEKLENAPGCHQGYYALDVGYDDTLALCIGYWLPDADGNPGRKVVAIDDLALEDIPWEDDLPIAKFVFQPVAGSWLGQGGPEQMLPLQREVDRLADNLAEQERRFAWCKWIFSRGAQIDPDELIGNANVEYNDGSPAPEAVQGVAPTKELYQQLQKKGEQALFRVGISGNQAEGRAPEGLNSGIAQIAAMQIDDVRHVAAAQRLEDAVEQLGKLIVQAAGGFKPKVYSSGKVMPWPEVVADQKKAMARAFKLSGLPQSIPGRKQELFDMRQNGEIDNITYRRATGTNEVRPTTNVITVSEDFTLYQLDEMVKTGKFEAPIDFMDMQRALTLAQARVLTEIMNKIPEEKIQLLAVYAAMCVEKMEEILPTQPEPVPGAQPGMAPGAPPIGAPPMSPEMPQQLPPPPMQGVM